MYKTKTSKAWAIFMPSGRLFCAKTEKQAAINCAMAMHRHPLETWDDLSANGWTLEEVEVTIVRMKR